MRKTILVATCLAVLATLAIRGTPPSALAQTTSAQGCVQHGGAWETGLIRSAELKGPFVVTSLQSSADPSKSKSQFLLLHDASGKPDALDNEWVTLAAFNGPIYLRANATLKPRVQDVNYAGAIYSGCRLK